MADTAGPQAWVPAPVFGIISLLFKYHFNNILFIFTIELILRTSFSRFRTT